MAEKEAHEQKQKPSSKNQKHAAQWERQTEWLERLRSHQQTLVSQGVEGWDLMEAMSTLKLEHKISIAQQHRCPRCWHDRNIRCICPQLAPLKWTKPLPNVKILILMHPKEYLGAGNSAKLLLQLLPDQTELYLFGKEGDVDRLFQEMAMDETHTMILWPAKDALSVTEFLEQAENQIPTTRREANNSDNIPPKEQPPLIRAVVLDGTYTQARNMHHSLRKRLGKDLPFAVQLRPTTGSVFHRAQKSYGKAHQQLPKHINEDHQFTPKQQQLPLAQRISTAEACGLLLLELGANKEIQETIVQAVVVNNEALGYAGGTREVETPIKREKDKSHLF